MPAPEFVIYSDADALAQGAADLISESAQHAVQRRGRFTLVLAGGSTPRETYRALGQPERIAAVPWLRTYLFFGDERFVPPGDVNSNIRMVQEALLSRVPVSASQVFPVPTHFRSAAESAAAYADELAQFFAVPADAAPPRFDLILLGLGDDGHTASLFPGARALQERVAWVTGSPPGRVPPAVDRITLTYPVLNAARRVVFLVSGEKKAAALRDVLERQPNREQCPAAGVQPLDGATTWLVDEGATRLLSTSVLTPRRIPS